MRIGVRLLGLLGLAELVELGLGVVQVLAAHPVFLAVCTRRKVLHAFHAAALAGGAPQLGVSVFFSLGPFLVVGHGGGWRKQPACQIPRLIKELEFIQAARFGINCGAYCNGVTWSPQVLAFWHPGVRIVAQNRGGPTTVCVWLNGALRAWGPRGPRRAEERCGGKTNCNDFFLLFSVGLLCVAEGSHLDLRFSTLFVLLCREQTKGPQAVQTIFSR